ncbi:MAG TPA: aminoglycoside 3'-phosphotransferase/choline kinase family protein [Bradyrhizobium sp.]|jgi:hygromycin-B 7''-O-kinase
MHSLPNLSDIAAYHAWRAEPSHWLPAALDIARAHGLPHGDPQPFRNGTNLVVALDEKLILKIFPPLLRAQYLSERASLSQIRGRVKIPVPEIAAEGERDHWPYLAMTRLQGVVGSEVWADLPERDKERVIGQIGETIAEVQRVPLGDLAMIEPRWDEFMRGQIEGCLARHTRLGLPHKFLDGLGNFLAATTPLIPMDARPVILVGEYIPQNFLLAERADGWHVAGLFDFGDVLTGWGEYDLLGPGAFMTAGTKRRVRSLLEGFGYSDADFGPALKQRLMALMLLHRASDLTSHICIDGWQDKADNLFDLAELLWPV